MQQRMDLLPMGASSLGILRMPSDNFPSICNWAIRISISRFSREVLLLILSIDVSQIVDDFLGVGLLHYFAVDLYKRGMVHLSFAVFGPLTDTDTGRPFNLRNRFEIFGKLVLQQQ
jgi:hypothetical protein